MSKNKFSLPIIYLVEPTETASVIGGATGQGHIGEINKPNPMSFAAWVGSDEAEGYDFGNPGYDFQDYIYWWIDNQLGQEAWNSYNPDNQWGSGNYNWTFTP